MIKADELYKACQEMSNKGFVTNDLNEAIQKIENAKRPKGSLLLTQFDYIDECLNDAILSLKKGNNSQRVKFPDTKTDFTKKTERNKNRRKHVNPEWLNDIIRERYQLIEQIYDLKIKAEDTYFKIDALEFEVKELKLEAVFRDHNDD